MIYDIDEKSGKYIVTKENKKGEFVKASKPFNSFVEADKYARKISNDKTDVILTDIPF